MFKPLPPANAINLSMGTVGLGCLVLAGYLFIAHGPASSDASTGARSAFHTQQQASRPFAAPLGAAKPATARGGLGVSSRESAVAEAPAPYVEPGADPSNTAPDTNIPRPEAADPTTTGAASTQPTPTNDSTATDSTGSSGQVVVTTRRRSGLASPRRSSTDAVVPTAPVPPTGIPESSPPGTPETPLTPASPEDPQTPEPPPIDETRYSAPVVDFIIGGSHDIPAERLVGWGLTYRGWHEFVKNQAQPYLDIGVQRFILHNPFGMLPDEHMQLDQYFEALEQPELYKLTQDFVQAWRPVTDQGVEVIAYVGSPRLDPDSKRIEAEAGRAAGLDYAMRNMQPFLDANMSIALDAAVVADADTLTWDLAKELRSRGVKVYVEARPLAANPHWFDFPVISTNYFWRRSNPAIHPDSAWGARDEQLRDEVLRMMVEERRPATFTGTDLEYLIHRARQVQVDGHTPIVMGGSGMPPAAVLELMKPRSDASFD